MLSQGAEVAAFDTSGPALGRAVRFSPFADGYTGGVDVASVAAAVPEPASWAMMLLCFGLLGGNLRRRAPGPLTA